MTFGPGRNLRRLLRIPPRTTQRIHDEVDDELRFLYEERVDRLVALGMTPDEARRTVTLRFDGVAGDTRTLLHHSAHIRERRMHTRELVDDLWQDTRYAARGLARRPGFTAVAVLTLAIGIGANTAIFGAVDALLLRPLPFREPERLMQVSLTAPSEGVTRGTPQLPWSFPKFRTFRDAQRSFSNVALWSDDMFNVTDGDAERVGGESVTASYFPTLGVRLALGPGFPPGIDSSGGARKMVVISSALWSRRFDSDPSVLRRTIDIDGQPYDIVGVLAPGFRGLSGRADLLLPITTRSPDDLAEPWSLEWSLVARLNAGVSPAQAATEARRLGAAVYDTWPMRGRLPGVSSTTGWSAEAYSLGSTRVAPAVRRSLVVLFAAVGCVLLIACVNLANLLLGRATARRREIAVRLAIGAGRARLVRLLLTESVLLALCGGAAGLAVAWWGVRALQGVNPESALSAQGLEGLGIVGFSSIRLDVAALVFSLVVTHAVGILFGIAPALQAVRVSLQDDLKAGKTDVPGLRRHLFTGRRALVVSEVALSLLLLVGAGLMIQSLANRLRVNAGFNASNLLTLQLNMAPGTAPRDSLPGLYDGLVARMSAIPGVTGAAVADCPPLAGGCNGTVITFPNRPAPPQGGQSDIGVHWVTPGWFRTMQVPLRRGRLFTEADRLGASKVILINESAAKAYWPNEDPIGTIAGIHQGGFQAGATVVGIVGDVRFGTIDSLPVPDAYLPYAQSPRTRMMVFLRTTIDPLAVAASARRVAHDLSPSYPAYDVRSMDERVAAATAQARLSALLLGLFAAVALVLSAVGLYGVLAFGVAQRTREIGIRVALGAERGAVIRLVIGEGLLLAASGCAIGVAGALAFTGVLRSLLYEIAPSDPGTYALIIGVVVAAAALASWIPARRAANVDPNIALRCE